VRATPAPASFAVSVMVRALLRHALVAPDASSGLAVVTGGATSMLM
jgi:hypothetical protein